MTDLYSPDPDSNHNKERIWNLMTGLLLVGIIAVLTVVALIYLNPHSPINPFPRPTLIPTAALPTIIPLPTALPSVTPVGIQPTATLRPTLPGPATPTAILATPSGPQTGTTPTVTVSSNSTFAFVPQSEPKAIDASLFNPSRGCKWMGVAGQAFDLKNNPVPLGIEVQLAGVLDGKPVLITSLTGTATIYGTSGFEITLADKPVASKLSLWIRLLDQAGLALSDRIYFDTYADCSKNLIIINFKQVK